METKERREFILRLLNEQYMVKVTDLSHDLFVSEATIRRDLEKLEKRGHLKRVYGGAVQVGSIDTEAPITVRRQLNAAAKETIAQLAVREIASGNVIGMDSSTTVLHLSPLLRSFENLTVLTHGVKTIEELQHFKNINLYCSGGLMLRNSYSFIGEFARHFFSSYYTDVVFIACKGISIEHGISWAYDEEAALRKIMLRGTKKRVLLCDSTKFDSTFTSTMFGFESIDVLITEKDPGPKWKAFLERQNVRLVFPGHN